MCPESNTGYHLYSATPFQFSVLVSVSYLTPAIIDYLIFPFSSHCSHNLDPTTLCSALLVFSSTSKTNPHIGKHFSHFWVSASLALAHLTAVTHLSSLAVWTALLNATLTLKFIEFISTFSEFFLNTIFILWNFLIKYIFIPLHLSPTPGIPLPNGLLFFKMIITCCV